MKKRVLIAINDLMIGGAQKLMVDLIKRMDRERFEIHLVTIFEFPDRKDFYSEVPADVQIHRLTFHGAYDFRAWRRADSLLRSLRPDVVLSNLFFCNTVFRLLRVRSKYEVYTVEHNTYTNKFGWQILIDRLLARFSKKVIAVSDEVRQFTINQQRLRPERCITITNGIDVEAIKQFCQEVSRDEARKRFGIADEKAVFLNVGRLSPQKDQALLLRGFSRFLSSFDDIEERKRQKLMIAGAGGLLQSLEQIARDEGISEQVDFLGAVREIFWLYRAADVCIFTSVIEGFSLAQAEALVFGLPVITTKTSGVGAMIEEGRTGFLVEAFTPEAVSLAIQRYRKTETLLSATAIRAIVESVDIGQMVAKYEMLFAENPL
ncbi:glycosyltransferase [Patescibacteria group bacterium]|nr:glycosyltransferase [Patescibacteria group bacterium]